MIEATKAIEEIEAKEGWKHHLSFFRLYRLIASIASIALFASPVWAAPKPAIKTSTTTNQVELSTTAVLAKVLKFDEGIQRATFRFEEEFLLVPTGEKERLRGKVYLDRAQSRARINYTSGAEYQVWIDKSRIYFYDPSLKQVVIRGWDDFRRLHFQAFLDLPILFNMDRFQSNPPKEKADKAGKEEKRKKRGKTKDGELIHLRADPKVEPRLYYLVLGIDGKTGQPKTLDLVLENYRANLKVLRFNPRAKFRDTMFEKRWPKDVTILDLTKTHSDPLQ